MDYIFDCFFEEVLETLERSGLHSRQNRKNLIDHLNSVISGCCSGLPSNIEISGNQFSAEIHPTHKFNLISIFDSVKFQINIFITLKH